MQITKIPRFFVYLASPQKACLGKSFHPCFQKVTFNFCYKKQAMRPPDLHTLWAFIWAMSGLLRIFKTCYHQRSVFWRQLSVVMLRSVLCCVESCGKNCEQNAQNGKHKINNLSTFLHQLRKRKRKIVLTIFVYLLALVKTFTDPYSRWENRSTVCRK